MIFSPIILDLLTDKCGADLTAPAGAEVPLSQSTGLAGFEAKVKASTSTKDASITNCWPPS